MPSFAAQVGLAAVHGTVQNLRVLQSPGDSSVPSKGSFRVPNPSTHSFIPLFSMDLSWWLPSYSTGWPCICSLCLHSPNHWAPSVQQEEVRSSILPTHLEKGEILTREVQKSLGL